jgi:hypothetical protein
MNEKDLFEKSENLNSPEQQDVNDSQNERESSDELNRIRAKVKMLIPTIMGWETFAMFQEGEDEWFQVDGMNLKELAVKMGVIEEVRSLTKTKYKKLGSIDTCSEAGNPYI